MSAKKNIILVTSGWWIIWIQSKCILEGEIWVIKKLILLDSNAVIENQNLADDKNNYILTVLLTTLVIFQK